jgi:hypothetical protein
MFGALCDDSKDDTTAIQNAVDSLPSSGGMVFLPSNHFCKTTSSININTKDVQFISWNSWGFTTADTASGGIDFQGTNGNAINVNAQGFVMRDMAIKYPTNTGASSPPPSSPSVSQGGTGTLGNSTYYLEQTCVYPNGQTRVSPEVFFPTGASRSSIRFAAPACGSTATGWRPYASANPGFETLQAGTQPLGSDFTLVTVTNLGYPPLVNMSGYCAVYDPNAGRYYHVKLFTTAGSAPFGEANGLCLAGSSMHIEDSTIDGFNVGIIGNAGLNNLSLRGNFLRHDQYGMLFGGGASIDIQSTDLEQISLGSIWLVSTGSVNISNAYIEQQNLNGVSFALKLGDDTNTLLTNSPAIYHGPSAVSFSGFIQCNGNGGQAPIVLQEGVGIKIIQTLFSNCSSQHPLVHNGIANPNAGIEMLGNVHDANIPIGDWIDSTIGLEMYDFSATKFQVETPTILHRQ